METKKIKYYPNVEDIRKAHESLKDVIIRTPLIRNENMSVFHNSNIYLKREDLQSVRSYKIRGAYNKISSLDEEQRQKGVVCASAGNHAQGVAYSCDLLGISGTVFMPSTTPAQKISKVKMFGKDNVEVVLIGDTYDDASKSALEYCAEQNKVFIHPFDDPKVIEGQATVGVEILEDADFHIDYLFVPVGGGGLASGLTTWIKQYSPDTIIIGVEPEGAPSMTVSLKENKVVTLSKIDRFVDGAAVRRIGDLCFDICRENLHDMITVPEGKLCSTILKLYNEDAIIVEPAGALTLAALDQYQDKITGKNVVCVVSGSNNDIIRTQEIRESSLLFEGLKHYFIVRFPQRAGALLEFLSKVLGPNDDIAYFEYSKKNNRETGPALIGIELKKTEDFKGLIDRMDNWGVTYEYINEKPEFFEFLV